MKKINLNVVARNKPGREGFYCKEGNDGKFYLGYGWESDDGEKGHLHEVPISKELFDELYEEYLRNVEKYNKILKGNL